MKAENPQSADALIAWSTSVHGPVLDSGRSTAASGYTSVCSASSGQLQVSSDAGAGAQVCSGRLLLEATKDIGMVSVHEGRWLVRT